MIGMMKNEYIYMRVNAEGGGNDGLIESNGIEDMHNKSFSESISVTWTANHMVVATMTSLQAPAGLLFCRMGLETTPCRSTRDCVHFPLTGAGIQRFVAARLLLQQQQQLLVEPSALLSMGNRYRLAVTTDPAH